MNKTLGAPHTSPERLFQIFSRSYLARALLAFAVIPLAACAQDAPKTSGRVPTTPNSSGSWYEIARTPAVVAYLDTARIERTAAGPARIWFRFVFDTPMTVGSDTTVRYTSMEEYEELNCASRLAKDLEQRMETTAGVQTRTRWPTPIWRSIEAHPMHSGIFLVACQALGTPVPARPGA